MLRVSRRDVFADSAITDRYLPVGVLMDLSGYTVVELLAVRSVLTAAARQGVGMADLKRQLDSAINPALQQRSKTAPTLRICPSCDRGEPMLPVFREGVSYWACRSCRYSELEG